MARSAFPLALDGQDALQGGGGDPQALGHGDVVFHLLSDDMAADHQHPGAPSAGDLLSNLLLSTTPENDLCRGSMNIGKN